MISDKYSEQTRLDATESPFAWKKVEINEYELGFELTL